MWDRIEVARQDSDTDLFFDLMYLGEMVTKTVAAGLVTAISDDSDRSRYAQMYYLVRADGIGDWSRSIDDLVTSKTLGLLSPQSTIERQELSQKVSSEVWQYQATAALHACLLLVSPNAEMLETKLRGKKWFSLFAELRNTTRGHGATISYLYNQMCPYLEESIRCFIEHFHLFKRSWAYLQCNLSGKAGIFRLTEDVVPFEPLRKTSTPFIQDGVYVCFDQPVRVELIESDRNTNDFFYPNGRFRGNRFEMLSYITGNKSDGDASPYMNPVTKLPNSDTQGLGELDIQGESFGNLPSMPDGYVQRQNLENEVLEKIINLDRYPIITLVGRGGIGKTSLALQVLYQVAARGLFDAIVWFSARDIDLLPEGPKPVRANVLTQEDIADEFAQLIKPSEVESRTIKPIEYLSRSLGKSLVGDQPLLFVFDNFETVRNPIELYKWIDTYVRSPNKVLITTRFREFKADYPIEVHGMTETESNQLIDLVSHQLGIHDLLTDEYRHNLYQESDGHPYVIKVLLGEVAKCGKAVKIERIVASRDEILDALFERTFSRLSKAARRVFLTLSSWRSTLPKLAVEALLLRSIPERVDVGDAIEELRRSSLLETQISGNDEFLIVPLVASVFGKRKLAVSPEKLAVEADTEYLQFFGANQRSGIQHGIAPRVERFFRNLEIKISQGSIDLQDISPVLEFIARKYPPSWLMIASLHEKIGTQLNLQKAKDAVRRYLETGENDREAWQKLIRLCRASNDWSGEILALLELCEIPKTTFAEISASANRFNLFFRENHRLLDSEEKQIAAKQLAEIMARRLDELIDSQSDEASATDCSRLAWLYLGLKNNDRARYFVDRGLKLTPNNDHCLKLDKKLKVQY
ncbi:MAG: hypothetical protein KME10_24680 [Plectolyngbya sp. WJT66-NPBG17]|jgi:tetratricopeptide (TPR) repeat protein|nr:hypothetical protein [Plectolyngbya sp. WJT66-NPBG17]